MFFSSSKVFLCSKVLSLENKEAVQESVLERICLKAVKGSCKTLAKIY